MEVAAGKRVGPYEIVAPIGAGGMGEVWRAHDARIGRDVAIKFIPVALRSPDRLHRFEQEARAAGSLSHPNLVTVYDLGTEESAPYVVMELLDGETLRAKLTDEGVRIPVRKAIDYAVQIANGLAAAHEHGIVHRDLKPENIIITNDGRVKIVDFGLAKLSARTDGQTDAATQQRDTTPGTVLGTAGYMSPEQVRGQQVDHRSDIFSFGAILYEMLTGRRAFKGESSVETMNAILKEDPPELASSGALIPPALDAVVRHCLEKSANERFQSSRDLAFDLNRMSAISGTNQAFSAAPRSRRQWLPAAGLAAVLAAAASGWFVGHRGDRSATTPVTAQRSFAQLTFRSHEFDPALAPDGKTFAFVSRTEGHRDIYVQRVDGRNAINLTKDSGASNSQPAFSPDGSQIAFRSERSGGGIFVMGATGESIRRLSDFGYNPAWSPDGTRIVVGTEGVRDNPRSRSGRSTLWLLDARSGAKRQITRSDAVQPSWSPHGHRIAMWALIGDSGQRDIFTVDPNAADPEKSLTRVTADPALDWNPVWSPDGKWLYFGSDRDGTLNLWRVAIDEASGRTRGAPQAVTLPTRDASHFSISREGDIAFESDEKTDTLWRVPFDPITGLPAGEPKNLMGGSLQIYSTDLSPDGQWITFSNIGAQEDVFLMRADGTDVRQLTNDAERDRGPSFSRDGTLIYFYSERGGRYEMWSIRPDGSELKQVSRTKGESLWYPRPAADGKGLYAFNGHGTVLMPFNPDGTIDRVEPLPLINGAGRLTWARPSPDGTMVSGRVTDPPALRGIWMYSIAAKSYERLSESLSLHHWLPAARPTLLFDDRSKLLALDVRTKKVREIVIPSIRTTTLFGVSQDGRFVLVGDPTVNSFVWLTKAR